METKSRRLERAGSLQQTRLLFIKVFLDLGRIRRIARERLEIASIEPHALYHFSPTTVHNRLVDGIFRWNLQQYRVKQGICRRCTRSWHSLLLQSNLSSNDTPYDLEPLDKSTNLSLSLSL